MEYFLYFTLYHAITITYWTQYNISFFFSIKVNTIPKFWDWSLNDFSNGLFDDQFAYNGIARQENGFLGDGTGYLLGKVRLRQIRVKKGFWLCFNFSSIIIFIIFFFLFLFLRRYQIFIHFNGNFFLFEPCGF